MKFCIVGTGRCGTSLLRRMLNCHPDVFVFRETHWIPALHEAFGTMTAATEEMLDLIGRTRFVEGTPVTPIDLAAFRASRHYASRTTVRGLCDGLGAHSAEADGKRFWADKTPDYGYFIATLQLHWPRCRIIHIIRDGVRTAQSMAGHPGYRAMAALRRMHWSSMALDFEPPAGGFEQGPMDRYARLWRDRLLRIHDEAGRLAPGTYLELRFEDLTREPEEQLTRIADFVGITKRPGWLTWAAGMVEAGRGTSRDAAEAVPEWFGPGPLELLDALGYPVVPAADLPVVPRSQAATRSR